MKNISLLGSTGSIGVNVLNIIREFPEKYRVVALSAGKNVELLCQQIVEFRPALVAVIDEIHADKLASLLPSDWHGDIAYGTRGCESVGAHAEANFTVSAIVGAAGLLPTLAAINAGKDIGLANKETLVMAGKIVMDAVQRNGIRLFPVDSEHNAIFQALEGGRREDLAKIILTASGGPFREKSSKELATVTPAQALNHPNWSMGRKISVDSATLMNKGLEVIEASWLFDVCADDIEVVIHPQSVVHSLVEFQDGSVLAQLGIPDMRIPIAYALSYPQRLPLRLNRLDLASYGNLEFSSPDFTRFPALRLAFAALRQRGVLPAVLNAANEIAVEAFLNGRISFPQVAELVSRTMDNICDGDENNLEDILAADRLARKFSEESIVRH